MLSANESANESGSDSRRNRPDECAETEHGLGLVKFMQFRQQCLLPVIFHEGEYGGSQRRP